MLPPKYRFPGLFLCSVLIVLSTAQNRESCFGSDLFKFIGTPAAFDSAQVQCQSLGGNLASVNNAEENNHVLELSRSVFTWIGVKATGVTTPPLVNTNEFFFTDGTTAGLPFVHVARGTFPWAADQPLDDSLGGETCVHIFDLDGVALWNAGACPVSLPFICRFPNNPICSAPIQTNCLGGDRFKLVNFNADFQTAQEFCEGSGDALTSINNEEELDNVFSLTQNTFVWVGIDARGVAPSGGNGDPLNFKFTDGTTAGVGFLHVPNGQLPWIAGNSQPDDSLGIEDCVHIAPQNGEGRFNDAPCSDGHPFVCRVRADPLCLTSAPSISPSKNPTISPSNTPTKSPSSFPTDSPSISPSKNPTISPTNTPTKSPSSFPTGSPSISPSKNPTISPSNSPTKSPSSFPTGSPSISPSNNPTVSPTNTPTKSPSSFPTDSPSTSPSKNPTGSPINIPTRSPSSFPTDSPSTTPTKAPSQSPTNKPSNSPVQSPSPSPTTSPTTAPSTSPTVNIIINPTTSPQNSPTNAPLPSPTNSPSAAPSFSSSSNPTPNPTSSPLETPPFPVAQCVRRQFGVKRPFK